MKIGDLVSYKGTRLLGLQGRIGLVIEAARLRDRVVLVQWTGLGGQPRWHRWVKLELCNETR